MFSRRTSGRRSSSASGGGSPVRWWRPIRRSMSGLHAQCSMICDVPRRSPRSSRRWALLLGEAEAELQDVPELVEETADVVELGRPVGRPRLEVQDQLDHRRPARCARLVDRQFEASASRPAACRRGRRGRGRRRPGAPDSTSWKLVDEHLRVPDRRVGDGPDHHAENLGEDPRHAIEHGLEREVSPELGDVNPELPALALVVVEPVPDLERAVVAVRSEGARRGRALLRKALKRARQALEKGHHAARPPDIRASFANWLLSPTPAIPARRRRVVTISSISGRLISAHRE